MCTGPKDTHHVGLEPVANPMVFHPHVMDICACGSLIKKQVLISKKNLVVEKVNSGT